MIVWSRGLGKQRLPMTLADATLRVTPDYLAMEGVIEPVCWDYAIKLAPADLGHFLSLLAHRETARFMSERGGVLLPFLLGIPGLTLRIIIGKITGKSRHEAAS